MRLLNTLAVFLFSGGAVLAQVGIGTTTPNPNSVLELQSPGNNQGFLAPRLTTAQRMALTLSTADNGLLVYDTDFQKFYYWHNQWLPIRSGSDINLVAGDGIEIRDDTIFAVPDGDGDASNEIQDLSLSGNNLTITKNATATAIDLSPYLDADGDATNEIQDLRLTGNTLSITNNASATAIDLAPFVGTNTDNQTLTFNAGTGALDITGGNSVTITPAGAAGGILSGTYPNPGLALTSGNIVVDAINNAATSAVVNANRLVNAVVLDTESPAGGVITGSFGTGLQLADNAISTAKVVAGAITDTKIASAAVTDVKIATGAVTNLKIADGAVTNAKIGDGAVSTAKISDGAITAVKLANTAVTPGLYGTATAVPQFNVDAQGRITSVSPINISGVLPGGAANGDLSGTYPNPSIATTAGNNIVTALNNAATTTTIAASKLVGSVVLDSESPVGGVISGNFGTGLQIADNAITTVKVAADAITSVKIADVAVTNLKIADGAVTTAKIGDGAVSTAKISDGAITAVKLANTAVTPGLYGTATAVPQFNVDAQGRITSVSPINISGVLPGGAANGDLSGTYPNPSIATTAGNNIVTALNNAATTTAIAANKLVGSVVLDSESPVGGVISGNFGTGLQIADNAITNAKILDGTISPSKIAPSAIIGQVLTSSATGSVWTTLPALAGGTVTNVGTGAGLEGGPITTSGTISVAPNGITSAMLRSDPTIDANRAVGRDHIQDAAVDDAKLSSVLTTPGTYGSSTMIPTFTVNAKGRLTAAGAVAVAGNNPEGLGETVATDPDAKGGIAFNLTSVSISSSGTSGKGLGNFNVEGSHYVSFAMFDDGYKILPEDYILIANPGKPATIDLPAAAASKGRILIVRSQATNLAEAVTVRAADGIDGASTSEPLYMDPLGGNIAYSITVFCTGQTWITLTRAISRIKG